MDSREWDANFDYLGNWGVPTDSRGRAKVEENQMMKRYNLVREVREHWGQRVKASHFVSEWNAVWRKGQDGPALAGTKVCGARAASRVRAGRVHGRCWKKGGGSRSWTRTGSKARRVRCAFRRAELKLAKICAVARAGTTFHNSFGGRAKMATGKHLAGSLRASIPSMGMVYDGRVTSRQRGWSPNVTGGRLAHANSWGDPDLQLLMQPENMSTSRFETRALGGLRARAVREIMWKRASPRMATFVLMVMSMWAHLALEMGRLKAGSNHAGKDHHCTECPDVDLQESAVRSVGVEITETSTVSWSDITKRGAKPGFLEIFPGTNAPLTAAVKRAGVAVGKPRDLERGGEKDNLDDKEVLRGIEKEINDNDISLTWVAPPCTLWTAPNFPSANNAEKMRDLEKKREEYKKVLLAPILRMLSRACREGRRYVIEQPLTGSLYKEPLMIEFAKRSGGKIMRVDCCAGGEGGPRKSLALLTNATKEELPELNGHRCPKKGKPHDLHPSQVKGAATKESQGYPPTLCRKAAEDIKRLVNRRGGPPVHLQGGSTTTGVEQANSVRPPGTEGFLEVDSGSMATIVHTDSCEVVCIHPDHVLRPRGFQAEKAGPPMPLGSVVFKTTEESTGEDVLVKLCYVALSSHKDKVSLCDPHQFAANGVHVDARAPLRTKQDTGVVVRGRYRIRLRVTDGRVGMRMIKPTKKELERLPQVVLTKDEPWCRKSHMKDLEPSIVGTDFRKVDVDERTGSVLKVESSEDWDTGHYTDEHGRSVMCPSTMRGDHHLVQAKLVPEHYGHVREDVLEKTRQCVTRHCAISARNPLRASRTRNWRLQYMRRRGVVYHDTLELGQLKDALGRKIAAEDRVRLPTTGARSSSRYSSVAGPGWFGFGR